MLIFLIILSKNSKPKIKTLHIPPTCILSRQQLTNIPGSKEGRKGRDLRFKE